MRPPAAGEGGGKKAEEDKKVKGGWRRRRRKEKGEEKEPRKTIRCGGEGGGELAMLYSALVCNTLSVPLTSFVNPTPATMVLS